MFVVFLVLQVVGWFKHKSFIVLALIDLVLRVARYTGLISLCF